MPHSAAAISKMINESADPARVAGTAKFFKCGKGQYGEGDRFVGVMSQTMHAIVKQVWKDTPHAEALKLLQSPIHEERSAALAIWVAQFAKADEARREEIYDAYLANTTHINNWDLVDLSAEYIVGPWLEDKPRKPLYALAKSNLLWERRIAIISTLAFIRQGDFKDTLAIAEMLLKDSHDLIHKATGWMLREVGKRDEAALRGFLDEHAAHMPRTALRYAIEKFDEDTRQVYLNKE
jgi:3-methyladenine DNA glycosylase AlkD